MPAPGLAAGTVGVLPAGALGVAFVHHLRRAGRPVALLERPDSRSTTELRAAGVLRVRPPPDGPGGGAGPPAEERWDVAPLLAGTLAGAFAEGRLPEAVLVCCASDQLFDYLDEVVDLVRAVQEAGLLFEPDPPLPAVLLAANGIYFQRVRQVFLEKLEEAVLLGRLPDLWPAAMPVIVGRLQRAVTIQTGVREGSGADAVYRPGPPASTLLAGGDPASRRRVRDLLAPAGEFEDAGATSPTGAEFLKAVINFHSNVFGLLRAVGPDGAVRTLRVAEIYAAGPAEEIRDMLRHVLAVARAVRALGPEHTEASLAARLEHVRHDFADHIPSSLQWLAEKVRQGRVPPGLPPTEEWILAPLIHFARGRDLATEARWFESLRDRLTAALARAAAAAG